MPTAPLGRRARFVGYRVRAVRVLIRPAAVMNCRAFDFGGGKRVWLALYMMRAGWAIATETTLSICLRRSISLLFEIENPFAHNGDELDKPCDYVRNAESCKEKDRRFDDVGDVQGRDLSVKGEHNHEVDEKDGE